MSFRNKAIAAAAVMALTGAMSLAGATGAHAGTPSCGSSCLNTWNPDFGPGNVVDVFRQGQRMGQPIILFQTTNYDPAEDWSVSTQGTVADFFAAGMVSSALALHYGCNPLVFTGGSCATKSDPDTGFPNLQAFEMEYAPFGVDSGLCAGVAFTAFQGEHVSLQPCGVSAKTVWIVDSLDVPVSLDSQDGPAGIPLINGSDTNFSHPFVLTYPGNNHTPGDHPRPQLLVTNLTGFAAPGNDGVLPVISSVVSKQLWVLQLGQTDAGFNP